MAALNTLEALKTLLLWEGALSRSRVMEVLGVKETRASIAIGEFCQRHEGWAERNTITRTTDATPRAWREAMKGLNAHERAASFAEYLALTSMPHASNVERDDGIIWSAFPELSVPDAADFAAVHRAIARGYALDITYRSLNKPEPHARTIRPHSIVRAGRRWHVRAYCEQAEGFRDFTFGRMSDIRPSATTLAACVTDDEAWNTRAKVRVVAHPGLSEAQQRMIRDEYFAGRASLVTNCRACLVPYYVRELDAAIDTAKQPAPGYLLAIENVNEIAKWLLP